MGNAIISRTFKSDINLNVVEGNLSFSSNVRQNFNSNIKKVGNIVVLYLQISIEAYFNSNPTVICDIPTGFRPLTGTVLGAFIGHSPTDVKTVTYCYINKNGRLTIIDANSATAEQCDFACLNVTYITED